MLQESTESAFDPYGPITMGIRGFDSSLPEHSAKLKQDPCAITERKKATADGKAAEVEWLKEVVQKRPGWEAFFSGINHNLQNPDAARSWKFAVTFANEFNKTNSKVAVGCFPFCSMSSN